MHFNISKIGTWFTTDGVLDLVKYGDKRKIEEKNITTVYGVLTLCQALVPRTLTVSPLQQPYEMDTGFMPILWLRKPRFQGGFIRR